MVKIKSNNFGRLIKEKILNFDQFGEPTKLNFNGKEEIKSFSGLIFTLGVFFYISVFSV